MKFTTGVVMMIVFLLSGVSVLGQQTDRVRLANLEQDFNLMRAEVARMRLEMEQLARENAALRKTIQVQAANQQTLIDGFATLAQVNDTVAALRREMEAADDQNKKEVVAEVSRQIERLTNSTNASIRQLAKSVENQPRSTPPPVAFSTDYPSNGVAYEVQSGDSLSGIAEKLGSTIKWIQDANKIADPTKLQAGKTIFVPQKK